MSEREKCLNGELFNCSDEELIDIIRRARSLVGQYNSTPFEMGEKKEGILKELFGSIGTNVKIDTPFYCDYGRHIHIGDDVIINISCTFVDCNRIDIGNKVLIASNVQIYTATHPVALEERVKMNWKREDNQAWFRTYALPVKIEDNVWIGGGAIILPGITVGANSVIGAGSVVTRDIPPDSVAVGNPCRVIRSVNS